MQLNLDCLKRSSHTVIPIHTLHCLMVALDGTAGLLCKGTCTSAVIVEQTNTHTHTHTHTHKTHTHTSTHAQTPPLWRHQTSNTREGPHPLSSTHLVLCTAHV